jgi:hypothetical protein
VEGAIDTRVVEVVALAQLVAPHLASIQVEMVEQVRHQASQALL